MKTVFGIIGYGMVGQAIGASLQNADVVIVDPAYTQTSIADLVKLNPVAIFVCVPTPIEEHTFSTLTTTLDEIKNSQYIGITVVKSTVLAQYLEPYDVVYNPEFLSRATAIDDLLNPPYVVVAGDRAAELIELYHKHTTMDLSNVHFVDIPTASFIKYTANAFYALKVTYMNEMHNVANLSGANYERAASILRTNPMFGNNHVSVPGPDGEYGFGGPCLPKDTAALIRHYPSELLAKAIELNSRFRA